MEGTAQDLLTHRGRLLIIGTAVLIGGSLWVVVAFNSGIIGGLHLCGAYNGLGVCASNV